MKIKPLKIPEKHGGFVIELMARHHRVALLRKRLPELTEFRNFEVVVIQVQPVHFKDQQSTDQGYTHVERLPASESWGTYGWTFIEIDRARAAFARACAGYDEHTAKHGQDQMAEPDDPEMVEPGEMEEPEEMVEP